MLIGRMRAGKDHIAKEYNFIKAPLGFPLYAITDHVLGKDLGIYDKDLDRTLPGYRDTLRKYGQWGRGWVDQDYPASPERTQAVKYIRSLQYIPNCEPLRNHWPNFGKRNFWTEALLCMLPSYERELAWRTGIACTDVRMDYDLEFLSEKGFKPYLVICTEETRKRRTLEAGEIYEEGKVEISEAFSFQYTNAAFAGEWEKIPFPKEQIIWNDHQPIPAHLQGIGCVDNPQLFKG